MRLAFNATSLLSPLTGIGEYSRQLANGLTKRPDIETDFFYGAFWQKQVREEPMPGAQHLLPWIRNHVPYSYALRRLVQTQRFSAHTKRNKFDLYHEPNILPLNFNGPTIVTIHDLSWIRYPETHPIERVRSMNRYFERGLRQAALILTDSEFVKRELIEVFDTPADSIKAIPLGVDAMFQPQSKEQTLPVLRKHGLAYGQYLLVVGTLEPRKNLKTAILAYLELPAEVRKHYPLVLVGMKGWLTSDMEVQLAPMIAAGEALRLGYLERSELACITAGATMLIYPSLYEGFGLPPLEAMACGVPVIASNTSSLPEVVGEAGILINPANFRAITSAIEHLIGSPKLRTKLSEAALARSKMFDWNTCVSKTVEAYRQVLFEI